MKELTEKQKRFCEEYVKDFNATRAAIDAGYSKKSAKSQASLLLTNRNLKGYINELTEDLKENSLITVELVLMELAKIGMDKEGVERTTDRLKALELIGRHLAMFRDKVDVTTNGQSITPTTIVFNSTGVEPIASETILLQMLDDDSE